MMLIHHRAETEPRPKEAGNGAFYAPGRGNWVLEKGAPGSASGVLVRLVSLWWEFPPRLDSDSSILFCGMQQFFVDDLKISSPPSQLQFHNNDPKGTKVSHLLGILAKL